MHAYILNISQTITKTNTTTTKTNKKSVVWIQVCNSFLLVTHSQSRQKHKSHFNAITETISLSLFLSLSRVKVHSDVQSTATITLQNPSSSPGRVLSCLTLQRRILCAPVFALPLSVFSSRLPVIDRCFARVNTMYSSPPREAQDRPQTPVWLRAFIFEAHLRHSSSQYACLNEKETPLLHLQTCFPTTRK